MILRNSKFNCNEISYKNKINWKLEKKNKLKTK